MIKDEIYDNYIDSLFELFLSWLYNNLSNEDNSKGQQDKQILKNINGLELLCS